MLRRDALAPTSIYGMQAHLDADISRNQINNSPGRSGLMLGWRQNKMHECEGLLNAANQFPHEIISR